MSEEMPWVIGLTDEEVQELRTKKQELTEYGKEKIRELQKEVENQIIELDKEERKEPFYRFFVEEYYGTGEGVSVWLQISRNYDPYDGEDYSLQDFKKFIEYEFYWNGIEEKTEEEFMTQYAHLIPSYVVKMVERKDQPQFTWQTHVHTNYS